MTNNNSHNIKIYVINIFIILNAKFKKCVIEIKQTIKRNNTQKTGFKYFYEIS